MEQTKEQIDVIPECKAARWAWHASLIPIIGVPLFYIYAAIALYMIGAKGRTGFWLLGRGVIAIIVINAVPYFGLYLVGYSGYYPAIYEKAYSYLPKHGVFITSQEDEVTRSVWWFGKENGIRETRKFRGSAWEKGLIVNGIKEGKWVYYSGDGMWSGEYVHGLKQGKWISKRNGGIREEEYKDDVLDGKTLFMDYKGNINTEIIYKNGQEISVKHYPPPPDATPTSKYPIM